MRIPLRLAVGGLLASVAAAAAPQAWWSELGLQTDVLPSLINAATGLFVIVNLWGQDSQARIRTVQSRAEEATRGLQNAIQDGESALARFQGRDDPTG